MIALDGLRNIPEKTHLTANQQLYEKGDPDTDGPLYFASYGEPVFDQLVKCFTDFELPECTVRLEEAVPEMNAAVVAYAVSCIGNDGQPETRLITRYSDLNGLVPDEKKTPGPGDLKAAKQQCTD